MRPKQRIVLNIACGAAAAAVAWIGFGVLVERRASHNAVDFANAITPWAFAAVSASCFGYAAWVAWGA